MAIELRSNPGVSPADLSNIERRVLVNFFRDKKGPNQVSYLLYTTPDYSVIPHSQQRKAVRQDLQLVIRTFDGPRVGETRKISRKIYGIWRMSSQAVNLALAIEYLRLLNPELSTVITRHEIDRELRDMSIDCSKGGFRYADKIGVDGDTILFGIPDLVVVDNNGYMKVLDVKDGVPRNLNLENLHTRGTNVRQTLGDSTASDVLNLAISKLTPNLNQQPLRPLNRETPYGLVFTRPTNLNMVAELKTTYDQMYSFGLKMVSPVVWFTLNRIAGLNQTDWRKYLFGEQP